MKESFWTYLLIVLGVFVIVVMILVQDITGTSEEDYYLTKEVMQAAMLDSIDYGVYRYYGDVRIIREKFIENFTRRFAESVNNAKTYTLEFYEIYESPPKATVRIKTASNEYQVTTDTSVDFDIITVLSGILESKFDTSGRNVGIIENYKPEEEQKDLISLETTKINVYNTTATSTCFSLSDPNTMLNNKTYVKNITKSDDIKTIKDILFTKSKIDQSVCEINQASKSGDTLINETPNYILEMFYPNKTLYVYLWLYGDKEMAYMSYNDFVEEKDYYRVSSDKEVQTLKNLIY